MSLGKTPFQFMHLRHNYVMESPSIIGQNTMCTTHNTTSASKISQEWEKWCPGAKHVCEQIANKTSIYL